MSTDHCQFCQYVYRNVEKLMCFFKYMQLSLALYHNFFCFYLEMKDIWDIFSLIYSCIRKPMYFFVVYLVQLYPFTHDCLGASYFQENLVSANRYSNSEVSYSISQIFLNKKLYSFQNLLYT